MEHEQKQFGLVGGTGKSSPPIVQLLKIYSDKGKTLEWCSGGGILNRKVSTLKNYCRKYKIAFPDYTPKSMQGE